MPTKKSTKKAAVKKSTARKTSAKKNAPVKKTVRKTVKKAPKKTTKKASAKKTVKKSAAKKTTTKKSTGKGKSAKKPLVYADDHKSFWVKDGQVLNSLIALRDALTQMEKDVYLFHATGDQNDFANWVDEVLCDGKCAADMKKAKTPKSANTVVVRHLKFYVT